MRNSYLFSRFLITALVVAVPLVIIHSWTLFRNLQAAQEQAYLSVQAKSMSASSTVAAAFDVAARLLNYIVHHPAARSGNGAACNDLLSGIEQIGPTNAGVAILDLTGQAVCLAYPGHPNPTSSARGSPWFEEAVASSQVHLGDPTIGRITNKPVAPMSLVVRDAQGTPVALAVVSLDLLKLQQSMLDDWSARDGILTLTNSRSKFLVRSPETSDWFARDAPSALQTVQVAPGGSTLIAPGADGIERVFAMNDLERYGLRVVASIPATQVLSLANTQIRNALLVAAVGATLAAAFAVLGARTLARPMRSLASSGRAFFSGAKDAKADETLPGEFRELAVEMNAMYASGQESDAKAKASEKRVIRLSRFYEASSRANQAMSRVGDADELYHAICQLCVETGQASMASIAMLGEGSVTAVAWGGPAKQYSAHLPPTLAELSPPPENTFESVRGGESRVLNDYLNDSWTASFRANAIEFNVRSAAVVPFKRGGAVVGVLNLYADEVAFFDEELMRLLTELAADISFTLDGFDRDAAHARMSLELAKREGQLSGIVESAMVAIVTIDADQRIIVFNKAASDMFEVPISVAIGQSPGAFIPERFRVAHEEGVANYLHKHMDIEKEFPHRHLIGLRTGGEEFPMEVSTFRTFEGPDVLLTLVMRDVSAERDAESARILAAESEAANRAKTDFLSRMSHELRTPLNAVLCFSQLLQDGTKERLNEAERHQLDLIFLAGAQLRALVDDVLDVSVIEAGQMSLSFIDFELIPLLEGVMRMNDAAARMGGIELVPDYSNGPSERMHTDPIRLRQVMLNLVSNAIKYNRPGGRVTLCVDSSDAGVRISVMDTGLGMTDAQLANIFEPFNRLGREHSNIEGTGIGMTLVRQLVELMGGSISIKSESAIGTTVRVLLPRPRPADVLSHEYPPALRVSSVDLGRGPSGLVLYVEDNPVNAMIVKAVLGRWANVQLVIAEDGKSGIQQAIALCPDVVLLDMRLPDMTGLEVLEQLRASPKTAQLPVIALSASAMPNEVSAARAAGAWDYWAKPIETESFREGLQAFLRRA